MSRDTYVLDGIFLQSLNLLRFTEGERAKVVELLKALEREMVSKLLAGNELTTYSRTRTEELLRQARSVIRSYYADMQVAGAAAEVGAFVAADTAKLLGSVLPGYAATIPTEAALAAIIGDALIQGAPSSAWWARQAEDTVFRFASAVRQGLVAGETNRDIVSRLVGKRGQPGVMEVSRKNAMSLVATSVQTVANASRLETFQSNSDVIQGLVWVTTLDGHVCPACAARSDLSWSITDRSPIGGHVVPFANPPIHFGDRCVLAPRTKTFKELGINLPEFLPPRASVRGVQAGGTTFKDFLKRNPDIAREVLGESRLDMWNRGKITLQDLVSSSGRPLTVEQLRELYA